MSYHKLLRYNTLGGLEYYAAPTWVEIDLGGVGPGGPVAWGDISGTLSDQTDLQTALNGKASSSHNHDASYQPLDGTLTALAALNNTSGLLEQTGADTFTRRAIGVGATTSIPTRADADARYEAAGAVAAGIAALINSAPGALDTLDELAAALGDDANFASTVTTALAGKQPLDSDLTAIAALSSNGLVERTGSGTAAIRALGVGASTSVPTRADADTRYAAASHTHTASEISDSTVAGRSMLTAANAAAQTALLDAVSSGAKGLAPASGGGTTNYLRADGTWAAPPGTGGVADGDKGDVTVSGATWTLDKGYALSTVSGAVAVGLSSASAYATAETTISAATYADITGASVSLDAGTWLVIGVVNIRAVNAIVQAFVALTHNDNTVITETAASRPASGTASLNSPFQCVVMGIVSPGSTTTYKLRGARGLTTHTGSWIAMDGNGVNTTSHASNNTDKGTAIFAIRIA